MEKRFTAGFFLIISAALIIGETWASILIAFGMVALACVCVFGKEKG